MPETKPDDYAQGFVEELWSQRHSWDFDANNELRLDRHLVALLVRQAFSAGRSTMRRELAAAAPSMPEQSAAAQHLAVANFTATKPSARDSLAQYLRRHHAEASLDELVGAVQALTAAFNARSIAAYQTALKVPARVAELRPRVEFWNAASTMLDMLHRRMCEELERRDRERAEAQQAERQEGAR